MPKLSPTDPLIHEGAKISNSTFGAYCEVGAGSIITNSTFGDYAYCDRLADIANTAVGKFANIAAMTRIGPSDHPFQNAAQHHFLYRSSYYWDDVTDDPEFFAARAARRDNRRFRLRAPQTQAEQDLLHLAAPHKRGRPREHDGFRQDRHPD